MTTKKVVLKVEINEDKIKKKAMKAVSGISGVESVSVDMKDKKLTLTGDIDPVKVVAKLRKFCHTEMVSVGPAKEEKKDEPKKDDKKKEEPKKDDKKKEEPKTDDKKKEDGKKDSTKENVSDPLPIYPAYPYYHYYQMKPQYSPYYMATPVQEDPNGCVII